MPRHLRALALTAATLTLAGCATLHDPAQEMQLTPSPAVSGQSGGDPAPERNGTIPGQAQRTQSTLANGAGQSTPQAALERYLNLWANWTAARAITRQRQLAAISLGQARAQALQAASSLQRDPLLTQSHVTNTGQLVALAPGQNGAAGQWVLVSAEQTTGSGDYSGLPASLHVIYAQLTHTPQGWVVSGWQPQN